MIDKSFSRSLAFRAVSAAAFGVALVGGIVVLAGGAISAQDKYAVKVPDGLSFADFRGYEKWEFMSTSLGPEVTAVILGNPAMMDAVRAGIPGNGQKFPDGAKMAKLHWTKKMNAEGFPATIPDSLRDIDFMVKDSKMFADTGGWGYAQFNYDAKSEGFSPLGTGAKCGYSCHTAAVSKDYVFTGYPKR